MSSEHWTTITLHSNNRKALAEVVNEISENGWEAARSSQWMRRFVVGFSFGQQVTEDASRDYRFHQTVRGVPAPRLFDAGNGRRVTVLENE